MTKRINHIDLAHRTVQILLDKFPSIYPLHLKVFEGPENYVEIHSSYGAKSTFVPLLADKTLFTDSVVNHTLDLTTKIWASRLSIKPNHVEEILPYMDALKPPVGHTIRFTTRSPLSNTTKTRLCIDVRDPRGSTKYSTVIKPSRLKKDFEDIQAKLLATFEG